MKRPLLATAFALSALAAVVFVSPALAQQEQTKAPDVTYEKDIKPILTKNCVGCHTTNEYSKAKANMQLDTLKHILASANDSSKSIDPNKVTRAVLPNKPAKSLLYLVVSGAKGYPHMPPSPPDVAPRSLDKESIALIKAWIEQGSK